MSISEREPQAHFRLLDLPKEIRLVVYDRLPMRRRYHAFRPLVPSPESCDKQPFAFISTAVTGPALATCHQVHEEASTMLRMRIAHLDEQPLRFITSPKFLQNHILLRILQAVVTGKSLTRIEHVPDCSLVAHIDRLLRHQGDLNVVIAIRDIDLHPTTADTILSLEQTVNMFCIRCIGFMTYMRSATSPHLKLCIRTVLPVPDKDKVFNPVEYPDPLVDENHILNRIVRVAKNIGETEWKQDWAEGERYF